MADTLTAPEAPAVERMLIAPRHLVLWPGLNPRKSIPEERIEQLAASIRKEGVLQNLVVHETNDSVRWIVAGVTRWRAASLLAARGVEILLPCSVREYSEDRALEIAMLENVHRGDLTVIEEARGYRRLVEEFGHSQEELAEKFLGDRSRQSQISNRIRLLELPEPVLEFVEEGVLPWSYARDLLLPWVKREDVRDRFFSALVEHLRLQADFGGPVGKPWLLGTLTAIAAPLEKKSAPAPAAAPKPEPRWALSGEERMALHERGVTGYRAQHGFSLYHPRNAAFREGIDAYLEGYPEPTEPKSIDGPGEAKARAEGWRWAQEQHQAAPPAETTPPAGPAAPAADPEALHGESPGTEVPAPRPMGAPPVELETPEPSPIDRHIERAHRLYGNEEKPPVPTAPEYSLLAGPFSDVREAANHLLDRLDALREAILAGPVLLTGGERKLLEDLEHVGYVLVPVTETRCRVCGCTDSEACEGGCSWLETSGDGWGVCSSPACVATLAPPSPWDANAPEPTPDAYPEEFRRAGEWAGLKYHGDRLAAAKAGFVDGLLGRRPSPPPITGDSSASEAARTAYREGLKAGRGAAMAPTASPPAAEAQAPGDDPIAAGLRAAEAYNAAILARDPSGANRSADAFRRAVIALNGGTNFGSRDAEEQLLEAGRAPAGAIPHWGQLGEFKLVVDGVPVLVRYEPFHYGDYHFEYRAAELERSVSPTGYHSDFGARGAFGKTVDEVAAGRIAELVSAEEWRQVDKCHDSTREEIAAADALPVAAEWGPDPELLAKVRAHPDYGWVLHTPPSDGNFKANVERAPAELLQAVLMEVRRQEGQKTRCAKIEARLKKMHASFVFPRVRLATRPAPPAKDPHAAPAGEPESKCIACEKTDRDGLTWVWVNREAQRGRCRSCIAVCIDDIPSAIVDALTAEERENELLLDIVYHPDGKAYERWAERAQRGLTDRALNDAIVFEFDKLDPDPEGGEGATWGELRYHAAGKVQYGNRPAAAKGAPYPLVWFGQGRRLNTSALRGSKLLERFRSLFGIPRVGLAEQEEPEEASTAEAPSDPDSATLDRISAVISSQRVRFGRDHAAVVLETVQSWEDYKDWCFRHGRKALRNDWAELERILGSRVAVGAEAGGEADPAGAGVPEAVAHG